MAAAFGAAGIAIGLLSFALFARGADAAVAAEAASGLIPETEMPSGVDVGTERARTLLERYPHDPRAHLFRGFAFLKEDNDLADAEEQLRVADRGPALGKADAGFQDDRDRPARPHCFV
jgi:hypothetical protein